MAYDAARGRVVLFGVPADFVASARHRVMTITGDGRVAVAGFRGAPAAPAVLLASPTGEVLAVNAGAPGPAVKTFGLGRAAGDELVLYGWRVDDSTRAPFFARFAADGAPLSEVPLAPPVLGEPFALGKNGGLVAGLGKTGERVLAEFSAESGATQWQHVLEDPTNLIEDALTVSSQGGIVLATRRDVDDLGVSNRLDIDVFNPDGTVVWRTALTDLPYTATTALAVTPDDRVVVLRTRAEPDFALDLIALDLFNGLPVWFQTVAAVDESGKPTARDLIVDVDRLTIPVLRTAADDVSLGSVQIQQVSFDGELLDSVPLPVPANPSPHFAVLAARGRCGELVLLAGEGQDLWLGSFAP
jgi:outer membrane protein assembly factor BamB